MFVPRSGSRVTATRAPYGVKRDPMAVDGLSRFSQMW
jgi:hypothetical protein